MNSSIILPEKSRITDISIEYIEVNIDSKGYTEKKQLKREGETGRVTNRICQRENCREYTLDEFVEYVTRQGRTFLLCTIKANEDGKYTCKETNFDELKLLALDVDRGITWQEVLEDCLEKGLRPWLIYPTLSHTEEKPRFRVIFRLPAPVTDGRAAKTFIAILQEVFPYTDQVINSHTQRWYGGVKGPFYRDDKAILDPKTLIINFQTMVERRTRKKAEALQDPKKRKNALKNLARDTENAAKQALNLVPFAGAPVLSVGGVWGGPDENVKDRAYLYRYIYIDRQIPSQFLAEAENNLGKPLPYYSTGATCVLFQFTQSEQEFLEGKKKKKGTPRPKISHRNTRSTERQRRDDKEYDFVQKWNVEVARENCRRLDLALDGEDWLYHNELFHVCSHLIRVENGAAVMEQILNSRNGRLKICCAETTEPIDGSYNVGKKQQLFAPDGYYVAYFYHRDYKPWSCYNAKCPYLDSCESKSIINAGRDTLAVIVRIRRDKLHSLDESRKHLPLVIEHALEETIQMICLIKGDTGCGKTFAYIEKMIQLARGEEKRIIYACPTHRLAREVYKELKESETNFGVYYLADVEQHMPEDTRHKVLALYRVGAKKKAAAVKNEWLRMAYQEVQDIPVEDRTQKTQDIIDHWDARKKVEANGEKGCIIIMTHARYMNTPGLSADIAFIDEDILTSHLLPVMDFHIRDLEELYNTMRDYNIKGTDQIKAILDEIKNAPEDEIYGINSSFLYNSVDIMELITLGKVFPLHTREEGTALLDFLSSNTVAWGKSSYRGHKEKVFFGQRNELPNIKTVIASASLNKTLYSVLLGEKMHWQEMPMIAYEGQLIQYPQKGYCNTSLRSSQTKLLEEFQEKVGLKACITTKAWKEALEEHGYEHNIIGTFGAVEGLNEFEGQDLIVWGSLQRPPIVYGLIAYALGCRTGLSDCFQKDKSTSTIERNNYRFPFRTFSDNELLQEIHLYFTEAPLVQAVGRARLAEHPATVTVYSNFILPQAEIRG